MPKFTINHYGLPLNKDEKAKYEELSRSITDAGHDLSIFIILAVAAVVMTVPLLLAALLRRKPLFGVLLSLLLVAVATAFELRIIEKLGLGVPRRDPFIAINMASAVVILVIAGVVRLNGYCLFARPVVKDV